MPNIAISTPFSRKLIHSDTSVGNASPVSVLSAAAPEGKRILVIVQNQSASETITVVLNPTGSSGLFVPPLASLSIENYNGEIRAKHNGASGTVNVHVGYASV